MDIKDLYSTEQIPYFQKVYVRNITLERYEVFDNKQEFALWHLIADKRNDCCEDWLEQEEFYLPDADYKCVKQNGYYMT